MTFKNCMNKALVLSTKQQKNIKGGTSDESDSTDILILEDVDAF